MLDLATLPSLDSGLRPVALRMRPDLIFRERRIEARTYYVIKDPIQLTHHQLWEEEFALLQMLDGRTSIAAMKKAFAKKFPGSRLDSRLLQILHGQFHRNGLVLSEQPGQAEEMTRRKTDTRSKLKWGRIRSWMSIRFRGINPDNALELMDRQFGWIFDGPVLLLTSLFLLFTVLFFAVQSTSVLANMPSIDETMTARTMVLIYLAFAGLKIIHEIGHGLACKHYGGECNEMGFMLLVFTPCLYCDVTDSWMVESKWKRAMIGAAGIYFEFIVASVCMWLWWFSNPGILHSLSFQVVLVGSIGTLLFNGNPLLKYDGYFVLSDLLDRQNLSQQAHRVLWNAMSQVYLVRAPQLQADYSGRGNGGLWVYGVLAVAYRICLSVVILFVVFELFRILRLELVGLLLVGSVLVGWLIKMSSQVGNWVNARGGLQRLRKGRVSLTMLACILMIAVIAWLPLPTRLVSDAFIELQAVQSVVVLVDARLQSCEWEGTVVRKGEVIAKLVSEDLELSLIARRGELSKQKARLIGLESRRGVDPNVSAMMPAVHEAIHGLEQEVQRLESDVEQLTLRSPMDGTLLAPISNRLEWKPDEIQTWSGSPMQPENRGCFLPRGTTFCEVGDARGFQATVYLTQPQVELVRPGHVVFVKSEALPSRSFRGTISEIGSASKIDLPIEIARSGIVPSRFNRNGRPESLEPIFVAKISIDQASLRGNSLFPMHHSIARAMIQIDSQSLGDRFARFVYSTFAIDPTVKQKAVR